ncbi:MAG: DUF1543 domain-containing protein [Flavobacterium sp.]|nr:MAG: DUF1543 domain-containing protein [Flavobacterium sp.]
MENELQLFVAIIGCKPNGRLTEQHDIFFGVGKSLKDLTNQMEQFWPEAVGNMHLDAWRTVSSVDGHSIEVVKKEKSTGNLKLFFINLGGYRPGEFEEYHYKMLVVADSLADAIKISKQTAFYKHAGFKGAPSHIDDKYGVDVDDTYLVEDILPSPFKEKYSLRITPSTDSSEDKLNIGYFDLKKL